MLAATPCCGNTRDGDTMATLTIGDKVQAPEPNTYTLSITTYAGDADHYETLTIKGFRRVEDKELLLELLDLFPAMRAAFPNGRGGSDNYRYGYVESLDVFRAWFNEDGIREDVEAFLERTGQLDTYWPEGVNRENDNTVDEWELTYYDDNSNAFAVTINY